MTLCLPTEVWRSIIRNATFCGIDFDGRVIQGLDMNWFTTLMKLNAAAMRTKIALTEVSHQFMQLAAEYLYEIVTIVKSSEASNLLAKLTQATDSELMLCHCQWIKFILVQDISDSEIAPILSDVLSLCRGLKGFSWIVSGHGSEWNPLQVELTRQIPTEMEFLNWSGQALRGTITASSASLRVLHIGGLKNDSTPSYGVFPFLTHLSFRDTCLPLYLFAASSMPRLVDLSLQVHFWDVGLLRSLLDNVATTLRILRLGDRTIVKPPVLSTILDCCRDLQELHYNKYKRDTGYPSHPWTSTMTHHSLARVIVSYV